MGDAHIPCPLWNIYGKMHGHAWVLAITDALGLAEEDRFDATVEIISLVVSGPPYPLATFTWD